MAKRKKKEKKSQKKKHWRKDKSVYLAYQQAKERDEYKCQVCGSEIKITMHHLWCGAHYPSLRADPMNLICLCDEHHTDFHRIFNGYSDHQMINLSTFIVWLRMNQYSYNENGESVENKRITKLIETLLERRPYLEKMAKQDENKRKCKKEVCV